MKPAQEPKQPEKKQIKHLWTAEENEKFMEGLRRYGEKGIKEIAEFIKTRNTTQVRSHLQKFKLKNPSFKEAGEASSKGKKAEEKKSEDAK